MASARTLKTEEIEAFHRDGFLLVENVFDPERLADFGAAVDAAVAGRAGSDRRALAEKSLYEQSFIRKLWTLDELFV